MYSSKSQCSGISQIFSNTQTKSKILPLTRTASTFNKPHADNKDFTPKITKVTHKEIFYDNHNEGNREIKFVNSELFNPPYCFII